MSQVSLSVGCQDITAHSARRLCSISSSSARSRVEKVSPSTTSPCSDSKTPRSILVCISSGESGTDRATIPASSSREISMLMASVSFRDCTTIVSPWQTGWMAEMRCVIALLFLGASAVLAQPYDLLISGGRVLDGTGNPAVYADVAIQGGRIAAIGHLRGAA